MCLCGLGVSSGVLFFPFSKGFKLGFNVGFSVGFQANEHLLFGDEKDRETHTHCSLFFV